MRSSKTFTASAPEQQSLPASVWLFTAVALGLTAICILAEIVWTLRGLGYPHNWPLMPFYAHLPDFTLYQPLYAHFHSRAFFAPSPYPNLYPAPATLIYKFFFLLKHPTFCFLVSSWGIFLGALLLFGRLLRFHGISRKAVAALLIALFATAYPFYFCFQQGNVEIVQWAIIAGGISAFLKGRNRTAATLIGIAGSLKIYPIIFLGLFLSRKQYRECAWGVVVAVVSTVVSLWLVCPDIPYSWHHIQQGVDEFRRTYILAFSWTAFDHSLFAVVKTILHFHDRVHGGNIQLPNPEFEPALHIYMAALSVIGILLYFLRIRKLPVPNQILCLTVAAVLFPPTSYDYTLMHLYVPLAVLVLFAIRTRGVTPAGLKAAFVCLALLIAPESELIHHGYGYGDLVKTAALVALLIIGLWFPFGETEGACDTLTNSNSPWGCA